MGSKWASGIGKWAALALVSLALAGCGGGGGSGSNPAAPVNNLQLSGIVVDGPVVSATVGVRDAEGTLLAETTTDGSARYAVDVAVEDAVFPLTVSVTGGTNLVTGGPPEVELVSFVSTPLPEVTANVTMLSTLAVGVAEQMSNGLTISNLGAANKTLRDTLSFGLDAAAFDQLTIVPVADDRLAGILKASETLAEMLRRTTSELMITGEVASTGDVLEALQADLVDGALDGVGAPAANPRVAAVSVLVIAQVMLEAITNALQVNGVDANGLLNSALQQVLSVPDAANTVESVPVSAAALEQTRRVVQAAMVLNPDPTLETISGRLDDIQPDTSSDTVAAMLPVDSADALEPAMAEVRSGSNGNYENYLRWLRHHWDRINSEPQLSGTPPSQTLVEALFRFLPNATDPDGDTLTFSIVNKPAWATFDSRSGELYGTPNTSDVGEYSNIEITASDGQSTSSLEPFTLAVVDTGTLVDTGNSPPTISGTPATQVTVGNAYSFTPSAADADGDRLTFSITNKPAWATFNTSTGALSGTPSASHVGTSSSIRIAVSDGQDSATLPAFTITVNGLPNRAPTISGTPTPQVTVGSAYSFTPSAADADGDRLTFSITSKPAWASFDTASGRLSGTPGDADIGTYGNIRITVTDGEDSATLPAFQIVVDEPIVQSVFHQGDDGLLVMEAEHFDTNVGGNGVGPWQLVNPADAFNAAAIKAVSGTFTGSPDTSRSEYRAKFVASGSHYIWLRFRAFDTGSDSMYVEFDSNGPAQINPPDRSGNWIWARVSGVVGVTPGLHTIKLYRRESNLEVDRVLLTTSSSYTPTGLGPAESSRAAPDEDAPPPPNLPPVISGTPSAQTTIGQAYSFSPAAYDPEGSALSFGIQGRPAWATFNSTNGRLQGTPDAGDVGTYENIVISVTDGSNSAQLPAFTIEVLGSATGGFTVTWDPPLTNVDGSTLTDLAGYRVYRGTQPGQYSEIVEIDEPGVTSHVFDQLPLGTTHYIVVTSVDASGNESAPSEEVSVTL
jgi:hypothetical protein